MGVCEKCGKELEEDVEVCKDCESKVNENKTQDDLEKLVDDITNTKDTTSEFEFNDILNNKYISVFSYIGILILIPVFLKRDSKFVRYHVNQGLMLIISSVILMAITSIIAKLPIIGFIGGILSIIVSLSIVMLAVIGIINCVKGKAKELPAIGKYRILK